jgi:hypothetical protein
MERKEIVDVHLEDILIRYFQRKHLVFSERMYVEAKFKRWCQEHRYKATASSFMNWSHKMMEGIDNL